MSALVMLLSSLSTVNNVFVYQPTLALMSTRAYCRSCFLMALSILSSLLFTCRTCEFSSSRVLPTLTLSWLLKLCEVPFFIVNKALRGCHCFGWENVSLGQDLLLDRIRSHHHHGTLHISTGLNYSLHSMTLFVENLGPSVVVMYPYNA